MNSNIAKKQQTPTQKMPTAFFANDPGNRQQATGNYTPLLNNRVNNPIVYIHPKIRYFYGLLSASTLIVGMVIYLLFRDVNNMILFSWIPKPAFLGTILIPLKPSIYSNILRYNIPDMLWFVSAILFLRFIWFYKTKEQTVYLFCFYGIGLVFEISQLSRKIPGTFDWLDLLFFGIGAFIEGLLYKTFFQRRFI